MSKLMKPEGYRALLDLKQTELAIKNIKDFFLSGLSTELRLRRVTAPLFVLRGLGLNDDLNGVERPVSFPVKDMNEAVAEVVHSLAKWKRVTLADYQIDPGFGIITDMNAIRPDEELDNIHSLYVDQWDWERVILPQERTIAFLKRIVRKIYSTILRTEFYICETYPQLQHFLPGLCSSWASAASCPTARSTTCVHPTMMTGAPPTRKDSWDSMVTCWCGIPPWAGASNSAAWVSA